MGNISKVSNQQYSNYLNNAMTTNYGDPTFVGLGALNQPSIFNSNPYTASYNNGFYPTDFSGMGSMYNNPMMGGTYNPSDPQSVDRYLQVQNRIQDAQLANQKKYTEAQMNYNQQLQDEQTQNQVAYQHKVETEQFNANGKDAQISQDVANLQEAIKSNEQDNVAAEYGKLQAAVRDKLNEGNYEYNSDGKRVYNDAANYDSKQLNAYVEQMYQQQTGSSLISDLTKYGDSDFVRGLKDPFGLASVIGVQDKTSTTDNISRITGAEASKNAGVWSTTGKIASGLGLVTATAVATPYVLKGAGKAGKGLLGIILDGFKSLKHVKA